MKIKETNSTIIFSAFYMFIGLFLSVGLVIFALILWIDYNDKMQKNDNLWVLYLTLIISGFLILWQVLEKGIKSDKELKNKIIQKFDDYKLLAHFKYTKNEWDDFTKKSYLEKRKTYYIYIFILCIIIIIVNVVFEKESRLNLIPINIIILLSLLLIKYFFFKKIKGVNSDMGNYVHLPEVKIAQPGILINNTYLISYHNNDGWLDICYSNLYNKSECITFQIRRSTGTANPKYQIFNLLIPLNKLEEKENIIDIINEYRVYKKS
ncbi:hypothetical protein [Algibacter sp. Ld11]|uniref:hypothetical protein n=1 Tax=Algibacter sp. Ld11 TaxID=649150 RepID=UPI003866C6C6